MVIVKCSSRYTDGDGVHSYPTLQGKPRRQNDEDVLIYIFWLYDAGNRHDSDRHSYCEAA
jgi:hypothetical protein